MAGTGTNAYSYRALFLGYFCISLDSSAKGWLTGVLFGYGHRADDTMGGIYRLGAAFALISDVGA